MPDLGTRTSIYQPEQPGRIFPEEPKFNSPEELRMDRKKRLVAACHAFAEHGLDYGFAGHLTVRDPERPELYWTNPMAVHFAQVSMSNLILVDHDGMVIEGDYAVNRAGFVLHAAIHAAHPDILAMCHAHSIYGTAFAALGRPLEPITQDACAFFEDHAVILEEAGQVAVEVAEEFDAKVGISGVALTRMDGDGRGGAALSMRAVTGKPIRFVGVGEKLDALETFEPDRIAGRILGMGDIVALVERAQQTLEAEQAERMMKRFQKGQFNMNDLKMQLEQMQKMGGMEGMMGMMPGMGKMAKQMEGAGIDDRMLVQQIALIQSMTKKERANPKILQASRKKRIAAGAGMEVSELNKLLKMQRQMGDMMKKMGKMGKGGMLKQAMKGMFGKGGPSPEDMQGMDPKAIEQAAKQMGSGRGMPGGFPGMGGGQSLPPGLSGFGKKK